MARYLLILVLGVFLLASAAAGQSEAVIWQQTEGGRDTWGPSQVSRDPALPIHSELADDFELTGSISAISAGGYNGHIGSPNFPPPFYGVYVRFYAAGPDGRPGAMQAEYFRAANDPDLEVDFRVPSRFRVSLSPPFAATGRHFVSVQAVMDPVFQARWYWWSANSGAPRGSGAWFRDLLAANRGWTRTLSSGEMNSDLNLTLYGSRVAPVPQLLRLSETSLPRSGRLRITGAGFGFHRENSTLKIGGAEALVTRWTDTAITAYVPESAPLGFADVVVTTAGGESSALSLQVQARAGAGRVRWRFLADAYSISSRPVAAPDGTVYAADASGHLYALDEDGGLKWIYSANPPHAAQSLALGADGTVYMAAYGTLIAVGPDGVERWRVRDPAGAQIFAGPSVGPDGNIYAASSDLPAGRGLGLFSVTPAGEPRWNRQGFRGATPYGSGQEIVFGSGQLYLTAQNGLSAYSLDGTPRWSRSGYGQAVVGPGGTVYVNITPAAGELGRIAAYGPDGAARGAFSTAMTAPVAGPDGTVYASEGEQLAAFDPTGVPRWRASDPERVFEPAVSPVNTLVLAPGQTAFGAPCFLDGLSIAGAPLWRLTLPMDGEAPVYPHSRARFSPDGGTVYVGMTGNQYAPAVGSWLYAVDTAPEPGTRLPFLSVRPERVGGGSPAAGVVTLPQRAGPGGVTVTLSSSDPAAVVPPRVVVPAGLQAVGFSITTRPVSQPTPVTLTAAAGAVSQSVVLTVAPPGPASLSIERWDAEGAETFNGTVTLNGPAPAAGLVVSLRSSSTVVKVPASLTVPAGETSANFPLTVVSSASQREVTITASANGLSADATLWVQPVWLKDLLLEPNPAVGGRPVRGTLVLSGPAPEGGLTVYLESEAPALLTVPESVLIPEGRTTALFTAQSGVVKAPSTADLWAFTEEDGVGAWLDILPAAPGDDVQVTTAAHALARKQLTVEAASVSSRGATAPTLTVYDTTTGRLIGRLTRGTNGRYRGVFSVRTRPGRVTVRSSRGGAATKAVRGQ